MSKILNTTQVDASGARLGLYREPTESLDAYQQRVRAALDYGMLRHKESFEDSLDYITANRVKNIFYIEKNPNNNLEKQSIEFDGVMLRINEETYNIKEWKFLKDFANLLQINGFIVTALDGYSDYLKSKNVLQFTTERHEINYITPTTELFELDYVGVKNVVDNNGVYSKETLTNGLDPNYSNWDKEDEKESFFIEEKNNKTLVLRENKAEDTISFDYKKLPIVVKWSVFNYYSLNDANFDYRIKELAKVNLGDEKETPYRLSQEGAKLLNKCYKLSNTYWGK